MSGAIGGSKSESNSGSSFNQNVWGAQADALGSLYEGAGNLMNASKNGNGMANQAQFGQMFSQDTMRSMQSPFKNQMEGGAYSGMDLTGMMNDSVQNMNNRGSSNMQDINSMIMGGSGNNYADAMKDQYITDANQASDNMMANLDARANASGMSGGARHGVAMANGMEDINRNLQRNMAQTGFDTFDQDLNRKLDIASQADSNNFMRDQQNQNTIASMMGGSQNAMSGGLNFGNNMMQIGNQQQMMPWQQMGAYSNIIGSPTVLSSGSSNASGDSKGKSASGGAK